MSTLTKVLIVLLTVFSIFLCGIVVTYVANADNYHKMYTDQRSKIQSMENKRDAAVDDLDQHQKATEQMKAEMNQQLSDLQVAMQGLQGELDKVKRENAQLVQDIAKMNATVKMANETAVKLTEQSKAAETEVTTLRAEQSKRTKQLNETTQTLLEKMAIIAQLEEKNRQLLESKQEIEGQLNRVLQQSGRVAAQPQPVTPTRATAQPAVQRVTKEIGLNGSVMAVDAKNRLAQISIGAAAGVQQDMKFHVTRGAQFVCDILILEVFPDKAVGILDLVEIEPQIGDNVTTNL